MEGLKYNDQYSVSFLWGHVGLGDHIGKLAKQQASYLKN